MAKLTHIDAQGRARMVDVSDKPSTERIAVARGRIVMAPATLELALAGTGKKGEVRGVAEIAGVMAAKRTSDLIPMCHPLAIASAKVEVDPSTDGSGLTVTARVKTTGPTGVEMEALTAVSVALLTLYDMLKAADRAMTIEAVQLVEKSGGASGDFEALMRNLTIEEARGRMLAEVRPLGSETVAIEDALGRVLAHPLDATRDQPPFRASAMDGWAIRSADATSEVELDIVGESAAGHGYDGVIGPGQAVRIFTGAAVPEGADTVVLQEEAVREGDKVRLGPAVVDNLRPLGGDFRAGQRLLEAGERLDAWRLSLAAAAGRADLSVSRRPRIAVLGTGEELVRPPAVPGPWDIYESGSLALCALIDSWGAIPHRLAVAKDTREAVVEAVEGRDVDLLITIGGASVGDYDVVKPALGELGLELFVETINIRPGKPTWFGRLGDGRLVLGLPGNPGSAMVCAELFLQPLIRAMMGADPIPTFLKAKLAAPLGRNGPREQLMRVLLSHDDTGQLLARAPFDQDSSLVTVFAKAQGLMRRPAAAPPAQAGDLVDVLVLPRL